MKYPKTSIFFYSELVSISLSIGIGNGAGLIVKYALDRRYSFRFKAKSVAHDGQSFLLYSLMDISAPKPHPPIIRSLQDATLPIFQWNLLSMMRPNSPIQKTYLYPKPVDFRKPTNVTRRSLSIDLGSTLFPRKLGDLAYVCNIGCHATTIT